MEHGRNLWDSKNWDENIQEDSDETGDLRYLNFTMSSLLVRNNMIFYEVVALQSIADPLYDLSFSPSFLLLKQGLVTYIYFHSPQSI